MSVRTPARTRLWLIRVQERTVATKTITRICEDLGLQPLQRVKRRRAPRQLTLFEKPNPWDSVQVDVKVVKLASTRAYQYTACDDCTRYRALRLYPHLDQRSSLDFLTEVRRRLPFAIRRVQADHGTEFAFACVLAVEEAGIRHRYIRPPLILAQRVPSGVLKEHNLLVLELPDARTPISLRLSPDTRKLGVKLYWLRISAEPKHSDLDQPR